MTQSTCTRCQRPAELFLCWPCAKALRRTIDGLPWLAEQLATAAHGGSLLNRVTHHYAEPAAPIPEELKESPVPWNVTAGRRYRDIHGTLTRWVRDLSESAGVEWYPLDAVPADFIGPLRPPKSAWNLHLEDGSVVQHDAEPGQWRMHRGYVATIDDMARWLGHHFVSIMHSEDAALCADEIHRCFERGVAAINPRDQGIYVGPCPTIAGVEPDGKTPKRCREALYARRDDDGKPRSHVTCWRCRQTHDVSALRERIWAQANNFLMTGDEILRVLDELGEHLPRVTFYRWRKERLIKPRGWRSSDGRITEHQIGARPSPVFALAEVRELASQEGASA